MSFQYLLTIFFGFASVYYTWGVYKQLKTGEAIGFKYSASKIARATKADNPERYREIIAMNVLLTIISIICFAAFLRGVIF